MIEVKNISHRERTLENILVIISVRNEEATIIDVISSLQSLGLKNVQSVDDGSSSHISIPTK